MRNGTTMPTISGFPDPFDGRALKAEALVASARDLDEALTRTLEAPQVSNAPQAVVSQLQQLVRSADGFEQATAPVKALGRLVSESALDDLESTLGASWKQLRDVRARLGLE